jgi:hypothetical protein
MALETPTVRYARAASSPRLASARLLAVEIEELLAGVAVEEGSSRAYQLRLVQGLTRSLIDQIEELERGPASSRRVLVARDGE